MASQIGKHTFELNVNLKNYILANKTNELVTKLHVSVTGTYITLRWLFLPDPIYKLVAGKKKYFSLSWNGEWFDTFVLSVDLGGAQNFSNYTTDL